MTENGGQPEAVAVVGSGGRPGRIRRAGRRGESAGGATAKARDALAGAGTDVAAAEEPMATEAAPTEGAAMAADGGAAATAVGNRGGSLRPAGQPKLLASTGARWLAVATVALAVLTAVFAVLWNNDSSTLGNQAQAERVARSVVLNLTNLTPTTLDARINDMEAASTGSFATQLKQFFGGTIRQQLESNQAESQGQIRTLGIGSVAGGKATVVAIVDQTYANRKAAAPSTDVLYLQLDLTHTGSGWKVADVTNLSPSGTGGIAGGAASGSAQTGSSAATGGSTTPAG